MLVGALLVTIARPTTWPLALAAFLLRGGALVFLIPIVVLPTPAGLGDVLGPTLTEIAFGSLPAGAIVAGSGIAIGLVVIVGLAAWSAAALEGEGVRIVAADEDVAGPGAGPAEPMTMALAARVTAARLVANIPLAVALAWGSVRLIALTYAELTSPSDIGTPIVARVLLGAPEVLVLVGLAWMFGQIAGALSARRVVLAGDGVARGSGAGLAIGVRRPLSTLARFWIPTVRPSRRPGPIGTGRERGLAGRIGRPGRSRRSDRDPRQRPDIRRPVGRRAPPHRGRLRLAVGRVDRRRGRHGRGRSGGPWTADRVTGASDDRLRTCDGRPDPGQAGEVEHDDEDHRMRRVRGIHRLWAVVLP